MLGLKRYFNASAWVQAHGHDDPLVQSLETMGWYAIFYHIHGNNCMYTGRESGWKAG
jgi:hypothetical protein